MSFNTFQTNKLSELISKYKQGLEFEIRFQSPDEATFKRVVEKFLADNSEAPATIDESINILTETNETGFSRKEISFVDGVQKKTDHSRKMREGVLKIFENDQEIYKIALSSEKPASEFSMALADQVRIRLRLTILVSNWQYDFTAVLSIGKSQIPQLKKYKEMMLPTKKITPDTFLKSIPQNPDIRYEFEIEYMGKPNELSISKVSEVVHSFTSYINPQFEDVSSYQKAIYNLASQLLNYGTEPYKTKNGLKQLANQPKNLTKAIFYEQIVPNADNYYLSDKADGERCFVVIKGGKVEIFLTDRVIDMTKQFEPSKDKVDAQKMAIVDAEIVDMDRDDPATSKHPKLYLFDVLMYENNKIVHEPFEKREQYLDKIAASLSNTEKKILQRLDQKTYGADIREMYARKSRLYPIDGLVFTPANANHDESQAKSPFRGRSDDRRPDYWKMHVYKWKDPSKLSIDFLVLKAPTSVLGNKPYIARKGHTLYFLFSGISMHDSHVVNLPDIKGYREMMEGIPESGTYFPIQFSHVAYPYSYMYYAPDSVVKEFGDLHQQIGEFICHFDEGKAEWTLDRLRPDKAILVKQGLAFGNNYKVAEEIFNIYLNPLTLEMMTDVASAEYKEGQNYFQTTKSNWYKPLTKLNNFVKAQLIKQLEGKSWVVDLSAGRGGDLFTYNGYSVQNMLCMDIDQAALEELSNRAWDFGSSGTYVFSRAPETNMRLYTMQNDLNTSANETLAQIESRGIPVPIGQVDGVVCNLSIHYLMTDPKVLKNIVTLVDSFLRPGGVFIFTTFDGKRIFKLLENIAEGESWDLSEKDPEGTNEVKYSLRRNYKDKTWKMGLTIGVVHPFSGGAYYDEPLADVDQIIGAFEGSGFKLVQKGSFADWNDKYVKFNPKWAEMLTESDKKYDMLYTYVSLVKNSKKTSEK
jgi:SAM-dependent methyltransferase